MAGNTPLTVEEIVRILDHIRSLKIVTHHHVKLRNLYRLEKAGFIEQVYIGNYAITEKGREYLKENKRDRW